MLLKEAVGITGGLSKTSKMPGGCYSLPSNSCITGRILRGIKGSVCEQCYARKGRYLWGNTQRAMNRRLDSLGNPRWTDAMETLIESQKCPRFRWHDSGDLQSAAHLEKILEISRRLPARKFFLPTKEYGIVREVTASVSIPPNTVIRLGSPMVGQSIPPSDIPGVLSSMVVDRDAPEGEGSHVCPATYYPDRKTCGDCRACWSRNIECVAYVRH